MPVGATWQREVVGPSLFASRVKHLLRYRFTKLEGSRATIRWDAVSDLLPSPTIKQYIAKSLIQFSGHLVVDVERGWQLESHSTLAARVDIRAHPELGEAKQLRATLERERRRLE